MAWCTYSKGVIDQEPHGFSNERFSTKYDNNESGVGFALKEIFTLD